MTTSARILPEVTADNEHFWRGGADGELRILRCGSCRTWVHPPAPICRECASEELHPQATSGRATVIAFTVNHERWRPDLEVPFVIASVELAEQPGLRVTTNIVGCDPSEVHSGMAVEVTFLAVGDVWLPQFVPSTAGVPR